MLGYDSIPFEFMTIKEQKLIYPDTIKEERQDEVKLVEFYISEILPPEMIQLLVSYFSSEVFNLSEQRD